jgi:hypothetical protein
MKPFPPSNPEVSTDVSGEDRSKGCKGCGTAEEKQGYFQRRSLKRLLLLRANWFCDILLVLQ